MAEYEAPQIEAVGVVTDLTLLSASLGDTTDDDN